MQLSLSRVQNAAECDTTIAVIRCGRCMNIQYLPVERADSPVADCIDALCRQMINGWRYIFDK